jgi:hypothetical protein
MKRLFASILMIFYLIPAVGVTVSAHFCGGELMTISHFDKGEKKCSCGNKKMQKGCCEDKQLTFKTDDSHQKTEFPVPKFVPVLAVMPALHTTMDRLPFVARDLNAVNYRLFHPPSLYKKPLYLLHRVFRI